MAKKSSLALGRAVLRPGQLLGHLRTLRALEAEPGLGLLLPCNVVVEALPGGGSRVWFMDAVAAMGLVGNPELEPIAAEADERLRRVAERLRSTASLSHA